MSEKTGLEQESGSKLGSESQKKEPIVEKGSEQKIEQPLGKKPEKLKKKALKSENDKLREKLEHLEKLLQTKDKALTEEISKYAFLQAELENMRKHYIKQQGLTRTHTKANVITSFTPLIDSFEMAFKNHQKIIDDACSPQLKQYLQGFEGIRNQLSDIFEGYKVKAIDTIDIPFDYKEHEVMMRVLNDDLPEDTVLQVVQKGYRMNGEIIRPAKVIVSKVTPPPAPEPVEIPFPKPSDSELKSTFEDSKTEDKSIPERPSEETEENQTEVDSDSASPESQ